MKRAHFICFTHQFFICVTDSLWVHSPKPAPGKQVSPGRYENLLDDTCCLGSADGGWFSHCFFLVLQEWKGESRDWYGRRGSSCCLQHFAHFSSILPAAAFPIHLLGVLQWEQHLGVVVLSHCQTQERKQNATEHVWFHKTRKPAHRNKSVLHKLTGTESKACTALSACTSTTSSVRTYHSPADLVTAALIPISI